MDNNLFNLKIATPTTTVFNGQAKAISSANSQGSFDILAKHANFLTIIDKNPIQVILPDNSKKFFSFNQAIIYTERNKVIIFADPETNLI
jgi:F0F1-type ATP synthase epsilon subunit